jgi:hypothetical protein
VIDPPLPRSDDQKPPPAVVKSETAETPLPRFERPEWAIVYVTIIYAFLTLLSWVAIKRQVKIMQSQAKDARDSAAAAAVTAQSTLNAIERQVESMKTSEAHTEALARQAVRQTELTQSQLELSHRPWIALDVVPASTLVFDARGCVLECNFTLTNVGHSVAKHVSLWTEFAIIGIDDQNSVRDKLRDIMKQPQNESSDYGWLLFPGQKTVERRGVIANPERVQKSLDKKTFQGLNAIGLHLVGCVDYPSPLDPKKRHQTSFIFLVSYLDPAKGKVMGAFDPSVQSYANIVLTPTLHGAFAD